MVWISARGKSAVKGYYGESSMGEISGRYSWIETYDNVRVNTVLVPECSWVPCINEFVDIALCTWIGEVAVKISWKSGTPTE